MYTYDLYNGSAMAGPTGIDQPIFGKLKKKKHLLRIYSLMMFDWSMSPFAFSARREKDIVALNKHSPCSPQVQEGTC